MKILKGFGYLTLALVLLVASYLFIFSGSFHTPQNAVPRVAFSGVNGPIIVFGGTRATGLEIVRQLREQGADVTVAVRSTSNTTVLDALGVKTVVADALNADQVNAAMRSANYVAAISTLGTTRGEQDSRPDFIGNRNVIDAAKSAGLQRLVLITVVGTGDSAATAPLPARTALKEVIALKGQAEEHLRASGLSYTIIRPGGLGDVAATGKAFLADDPQAFSYIARADLAALAVESITNPAAFNKTLAAYDPTRKTLWRMLAD